MLQLKHVDENKQDLSKSFQKSKILQGKAFQKEKSGNPGLFKPNAMFDRNYAYSDWKWQL